MQSCSIVSQRRSFFAKRKKKGRQPNAVLYTQTRFSDVTCASITQHKSKNPPNSQKPEHMIIAFVHHVGCWSWQTMGSPSHRSAGRNETASMQQRPRGQRLQGITIRNPACRAPHMTTVTGMCDKVIWPRPPWQRLPHKQQCPAVGEACSGRLQGLLVS